MPFRMYIIEASREQPCVSRMNLRIFKALMRTISLLCVSANRQKRRSWGRMESRAEKLSFETKT